MKVTSGIFFAENREVFSWGRSDYGQLGLGDEIVKQHYSYHPTKVPSLRMAKQVSLQVVSNDCKNSFLLRAKKSYFEIALIIISLQKSGMMEQF